MDKKTKKQKASKTATKKSNDEIVDKRFIAATTRPQFKSGRKFKKDKPTTKAADSDDDADGGYLIATDAISHEGFGESLTAAIQSDSRFAEALTNQEKFGCVPLMDKYGRKLKQKKKKSKQRDVEENEQDDEISAGKNTKSKEMDDSVPESNDMESRIAYLNALSRGEISMSSDDSDEDSEDDQQGDSDQESDDDSSSDDVYGKAGVFDPSYKQLPGDAANASDDEEDGVELTDSPTPYMAILNLDWTNIRAVDVYAMLQSFCPPGTLKKVEIYPSDFGKEMMEQERVHGPSGLWKKPKKQKKATKDDFSGGEDSSDSEGSEDAGDASINGSVSNSASDVDTDEEEDIMNLNEATAKLYSHFPPQSEVTKNSRKSGDDSDEEGFDREKLRAYEAAKLRYYFAIATFSSPSAAESVYNNVDGMEMEHSAAEIDVRALPANEYPNTIEGRELRDECDHLPGKYAPPDSVVAALRQSRVSCSWETGDNQREKHLTRYGMGKDAWQAMAEGDDIKFYLASDNSSAGENSDSGGSESDQEVKENRKQTKQKAANMRSLLGLGSEEEENADNSGDSSSDEDSQSTSSSEQAVPDKKDKPSTKQITFTPGKGSLEEKIRSKIQNVEDESQELTPFQKYLEKRKQKRKERREAVRNKRRGHDEEGEDVEDDGMYGYDPEFGEAKFSDEESNEGRDDGADISEEAGKDDFFLEGGSGGKKKIKKNDKLSQKEHEKSESKSVRASTKEELELLIAGDDGKWILSIKLKPLFEVGIYALRCMCPFHSSATPR